MNRPTDYSEIEKIKLDHLKRKSLRRDQRRKKTEEREFKRDMGLNVVADFRNWKRMLHFTMAFEDKTLAELGKKYYLGIMDSGPTKDKKCYAKKDLSEDELFAASFYFNEQLEKIGVLDLKMRAIQRGFEVALKYTESGSLTTLLAGRLSEINKLKKQLKIEEIVAVKKFLEKTV